MIKISVKPVTQLVMLNDDLSKKLFDGAALITPNGHRTLKICDSRKRGIFSYGKIANRSLAKIVLHEFDRAVFDAVISSLAAGNEYVTPSMIFRFLGGGGGHGAKGTEKHRDVPAAVLEKIENSMLKFSLLRVVLDTSEAAKKLTSYDLEEKYSGEIFGNERVTGVIRGQEVSAFHLLNSVAYEIASAKKQIIQRDSSIFDLDINHTPRNIAVIHYIIRRVLEISGSNDSANEGGKNYRLHTVITFDDLYRCCSFKNLRNMERKRIKESVARILDGLVDKEVIAQWAQGGDKIEITLQPKKPAAILAAEKNFTVCV